MNRKSKFVAGLLGTICVMGCVPEQMYNFENYSETLYTFAKNQNDETRLNHRHELEKIITESETKSRPVPPGIYAELGYIKLQMNEQPQEAINLFQAESRLYPESRHFMERLIIRAQAKEEAGSKVSNLTTSKETLSN